MLSWMAALQTGYLQVTRRSPSSSIHIQATPTSGFSWGNSICLSSRWGRTLLSASIRAPKNPLAKSKPRLRVVAIVLLPGLSVAATLRTIKDRRRSFAPSDDPLLVMISSQLSTDCFGMLSMLSSINPYHFPPEAVLKRRGWLSFAELLRHSVLENSRVFLSTNNCLD